MGEAEIALLGVIAGALVTGLMTVYSARAERRNKARASAMLLVENLHIVRGFVQSAVERDDWWRSPLPLDAWLEHRDALANGSIPGRYFHTLAGLYSILEWMERERIRGAPLEAERAVALEERVIQTFATTLGFGLRRRERVLLGLLGLGARIGLWTEDEAEQRFFKVSSIAVDLPDEPAP